MLSASALTIGERLLIDQRRAGVTRAEAAELWGVTLYRYALWEENRGDDMPEAAAIPLGRLEFREHALIMRRRSRMTLKAMGRELGCSSWWVSQMETGKVSDALLREFWAGRAGAVGMGAA